MKLYRKNNREPELLIFNIMGNINIIRKKKEDRPPLPAAYAPLPPEQYALDRARAIQNGKKRLKATEDAVTGDSSTNYLMMQNRAIQTHLLYFCGAVNLALQQAWRIGYGEYRKRIGIEDLPAEHRRLKNWCQQHMKDSFSVVSVGVGKKGYIYIYFLTTNADALAVHDISLALARYLRSKKYTPIRLNPYEKDPMKFLKEKYFNDDISGLEELLFGSLGDECLRVMRAGFALPYRQKTLRTKALEELIMKLATVEGFDTVRISPAKRKNYLDTYSLWLVDGETAAEDEDEEEEDDNSEF